MLTTNTLLNAIAALATTGYYPTVEPLQVQLLRRWDPYAMPGDEDLVDPWGKPPAAYREMFDVIERTMPPLLAHLTWLRTERPSG